VFGLSNNMLTIGSNQEMQGKEANPAHLEYRVQHGTIDVDHLALVALKRVAVGLWMPYFRLITPTLPNGVCVPQRRYKNGRGPPINNDPVPFVREDGSYITLNSALWSDYAGLLNGDIRPLVPVGTPHSISLRIEVSTPYRNQLHTSTNCSRSGRGIHLKVSR